MPTTTKNHLNWAHPLVQTWFKTHLGIPTEPQVQGWPSILAGKTTLISAPTGSGKTLAAFLACIDDLVRHALKGDLKNETSVLYISPLKALSNDVHKNLLKPLSEITTLAKKQGLDLAEIRVAVRTGDTLMRERQAMLRKPPHILVTTPESLYILLTAEKSRKLLTSVKTVIVDEIHALANNKRGTHLALSLERLTALTEKKPIRIGLSATQKPLSAVAQFLSGSHKIKPTVIDIGYKKSLNIAVEVPKTELGAVASNELWDEIYNRLAELANENRSTLIFVNTRRLAERIAHHLGQRLGEDLVLAHHGSLSRKLRLHAENKLKNGELKALVATASLELGIDIGNVDLVCQIGSPRAISVALQRIGRAGHWHGATSKGRFFATTRDELMECATIIHEIHQGHLDKLIFPKQPLDILSQQIVATCATADFKEKALFELIKKAEPFSDLPRETFDSIITMLSEGIAGSRGRYGCYLFHDQVNGLIKGRRGARLSAIMSGGAIPDNALFTVISEPEGLMVGTLDEDFAVESNRGDVILLGTTSWMIKRIETAKGRVIVADAHGAPPSVPFWLGEAPARTNELSLGVSRLREKLNGLMEQPDIALDWLKENAGLDESGAIQLLHYLEQGKQVLGDIPSQDTIIAERFFDESGGMQLIIHSSFGARINKAWGLALRKKFCRSFNFELQASATDNGLNISLSEQHSFPLMDVFHFLHPNTLKEVLIQAVLQSPLFTTRWRWVATRSLALMRFRGGRKVPPNIIRMLSEDLLAAVFPDAAACQDNLAGKDIVLPDHPLINETMKDILDEALDLEGLTIVLNKIINKEIKILAVDTPTPSVFSHELLNANPYAYLDDAPLEERRARAVQLRRFLPESMLQEAGKLDPKAIHDVVEQAWPDIRNADEFHDFLQTVIAFPVNDSNLEWRNFSDELINTKRIGMASYQEKLFFFAAEKKYLFKCSYPSAHFIHDTKEMKTESIERDEALLILIRGWLFHIGPTTVNEISTRLLLEQREVEATFLRLEVSGLILRGHFRIEKKNELEFCERRLLARIHQETLRALRKAIEPVTIQAFRQWLLEWQHLTPETQLKDELGLLEIIKQLQGLDLPARAWESDIFSKRMVNYQKELLDQLCMKGIIGWGRLASPLLNPKKTSRINPSAISPIGFFIREESDWMPKRPDFDDPGLERLSPIAKQIYFYLKQKGASFFLEIERGVGHLKSEIETALWELVAAGLITGDSFDNLRSLIDARRRLGRKHRSRIKTYGSARWSLLYSPEDCDPNKQLEAFCWMLLKRYGIVFRDLLIREKNSPRWYDLLIAFRRLEDRGEIRGGRFISEIRGEQFALPYAVASLRMIRKKELPESAIVLSSVDPLNW